MVCQKNFKSENNQQGQSPTLFDLFREIKFREIYKLLLDREN